jgi:hypothetical protein
VTKCFQRLDCLGGRKQEHSEMSVAFHTAITVSCTQGVENFAADSKNKRAPPPDSAATRGTSHGRQSMNTRTVLQAG